MLLPAKKLCHINYNLRKFCRLDLTCGPIGCPCPTPVVGRSEFHDFRFRIYFTYISIYPHEYWVKAFCRDLWSKYNESDSDSVSKTKERISNYTRIMTVREPLERLVSAYKDKMLPTGSGGTSFGALSQRIHKAYADVTTDKSEWNFVNGHCALNMM